MGRRSIHTQEELRELILCASRKIIEQRGLIGFSAREIARNIGYSPGTIYNIFDSLDELLLVLQARLLGEVVATMAAVPPGEDAHDYINRLGATYVRFAVDNSRLWNLLVAHQVDKLAKAPPELQECLTTGATIVGNALRPLMPDAVDGEVHQSAQALWAGVHGITALAVTQKGDSINSSTADNYVKILISTFTNGLTAK